MKPEEKDQIRQRTPPGMPQPPSPPGERMGPPTQRTRKPIHIPLVFATDSPKDEGDRAATHELLVQCLREGVYYCPRCDFSTTDPEIMVTHLADEMNKSIAALSEIYPFDITASGPAPNPTP